MPLNDLNRQIYDDNSEAIASRAHEQSQYDPTVAGANPSPFDRDQQWGRPQKGLTVKQKRTLWIAFSFLILVALSIGGAVFYKWWQKNAFHEDRVTVSFEGPKEADSTAQVKYLIHYKNDNRVTLKDAQMQIDYSENFQPTDNVNLKYMSSTTSKAFVGDIKPMSEGVVELKGTFYAPKDFPVYLHATLNYTPSNGTTALAMENQIGVTITNSPVILEVTAPQQAVDGDNLEYVITYKNLDIRQLANMQVRVDFPQGFQMTEAQPRPSEKDSYWYVGNIEPNQGGTIRIRGQLHGSEDEGKNITISLGHIGKDNQFAVYNKNEASTRIVAPILTVVQKLDNKTDDIIKAGDVLRYTVSYQNTGTVGLRDAIITAEIKGKILDFSKISVEKGSFDGSKNLITWKASDVPALANIGPKATGEVHFSVPVKTIIPVENRNDQNLVVTSVAKIDSPDIPTPIDSNKIIGSNNLELKLASKVLFDTKGYYNDAKIKNSGPIPLETGKETTFAVHWSVINISNDISDAKVTASLPSGVRWTGNVFPANQKISYDSRTNSIVWNVGDIPAGTGVLVPSREIEFQVGVTPQTNQIGQTITLVNKSAFSATDTFTGQSVTLEGEAKDTQLTEDSTVGFSGGKVAK